MREGLKQAIMRSHRMGQAPYPLFITACPDGEGSWFAPTFKRGKDVSQRPMVQKLSEVLVRLSQEI
ncbi:hypothetical protein M595_2350 [Lyngbya aestuarii BL J]|uniref:Uncharacterized protein n=1 Tax=Lyngbya aestuarii BL J TaxID=1348334 RepID=U7QID9_9CYAN|nr:hypothetical protein M595_2350 [Lyngbya aestuarii BL J]